MNLTLNSIQKRLATLWEMNTRDFNKVKYISGEDSWSSLKMRKLKPDEKFTLKNC